MRQLSSMIAAAFLLAACGSESASGPHPVGAGKTVKEYRAVNASNGIDFYAIKDNRKDPDCFYTGAGGDLPPWDTSRYQPSVVPVIIGSNFNGVSGYQRLDFDRGGNFTATQFSELMEKGNVDEIENQLSQLDSSFFRPHQYTGEELAIAGNVGKNTSNPLDIVIPYYSKIRFVLIDPQDKFSAKKPFRVAVGVPKARSPFYSADVSRGGKVMDVKYLSLPKRNKLDWDYIEKRKCVYYYELSLDQTLIGLENSLETVIIIDPDGEGQGTPPPGFPPTWP